MKIPLDVLLWTCNSSKHLHGTLEHECAPLYMLLSSIWVYILLLIETEWWNCLWSWMVWLSKVWKERSVCIPELWKCPWSWSMVLSGVLKDGIVCGSERLNCPLFPKYVTVHGAERGEYCVPELWFCWSEDGTVPGSELWNWPWFQTMEITIVLKGGSVHSSDRLIDLNCPLFPKYAIVKFPWRIVTVHGSERERRPPPRSMLLPLGSKGWNCPWSWKMKLAMVLKYWTVHGSKWCNCPFPWRL